MMRDEIGDIVVPEKKKTSLKSVLTIVSLIIVVFVVGVALSDIVVDDSQKDELSVDKNDTEMIEIKVIHVNSTSSKTAEALKETIDKNGGNFQTIYKNLISVCDWSIETICQDGKRYRIDYLYPEIDNTKPHYTQIENEIRGFTHILRFYI